jgi:zinc protease
MQFRSTELDFAIQLLAELIQEPSFPADRFELERNRVLNFLSAMEDDPYTVGSQMLNQWIYRGSPVGDPVMGCRKSLRALSPEELRRFHRGKVGPQNTILVAVGDVQVKEVLQNVQEHFSNWENSLLDIVQTPEFGRQEAPFYEEKNLEKEQLSIFLGHLGTKRNDPNFYTLQTMDVILGGGPGFASRIPRRLRDEQGLAYSTYSDITGSSGICPGRFVAYICTSPKNRKRSIEGIREEITLLRENGVTREELEIAKRFLTGNFVFEFQSSTAIARFLFTCEFFSLPADYPERYPKLIESVQEEDVLQVARDYLDTVNYTTVVVGSV